MRFRAKDSAIHEKIAPLRANHIARITSDFKMDLVKVLNISGGLDLPDLRRPEDTRKCCSNAKAYCNVEKQSLGCGS